MMRQTVSRLQCRTKSTVAGCVLAALAGCQADNQTAPGQAAVAMPVPEIIRQVAMLQETDRIQAVVTITDGADPPSELYSDEVVVDPLTGMSSVTLDRALLGENNAIDIEWLFLASDGNEIVLASYDANFSLQDGESEIDLPSGNLVTTGLDEDGDGLTNIAELLGNPRTDPVLLDTDTDSFNDSQDNCPVDAGPQTDTDSDSIGDVCDNCSAMSNPDQVDTDGDAMGDVCDTDDDADGLPDVDDNCPLVSNVTQADVDSDGIGDLCELPPSLAIEPTTDPILLAVGDAPAQVTATGMGGNEGYAYTAASADLTVAMVEQVQDQFTITPVGAGATIVTFTVTDELQLSATLDVRVEVSAAGPTLMLQSAESLELDPGGAGQIMLTVVGTGNGQMVEYSAVSGDAAIATVAPATSTDGNFMVMVPASAAPGASTTVTVSATVDGTDVGMQTITVTVAQ